MTKSEMLALDQPPKPCPRGFRSLSKLPRHGQAVLVILQDGCVAVATFGPVIATDPALLLAQAFQVNGAPVAVRYWRPIPRNWLG